MISFNPIQSFLLFSLRGNSRFSVLDIKTISLVGCPFYRTSAILKDNKLGNESDGMAEGLSKNQSRLLALAEAYEKLCINENKQLFDSSLPFGVGCGAFKRSAQNRAYGEYFERLRLSQLMDHQIPTEDFLLELLPKKSVCIAFTKDKNSNVGSGYGLSPKEAKQSAYKSLKRKQDYSIKPHIFDLPHKENQLLFKNITPTSQPWLECVFYYHKSNP